MRLAMLVFLLASSNCLAEEVDQSLVVWAQCKPALREAATKYVAKFTKKGEQAKWNKAMDERIQEGTRPFQDIALDWFYDNEVKLNNKDPKKIKEACFYFLKFVETGTPPPLQMRDRMTKENFDTLANYLNEQVEGENADVQKK